MSEQQGAQQAPAAEPTLLTRVGGALGSAASTVGHAVADGLHAAGGAIESILPTVESDAEKAVAQQIPAIEAECVTWAQSHINQFAPAAVATLIAAVPQLAGFKNELNSFATSALTSFLGEFAAQFPPVTK